MSVNTIELNGKRYDALTGTLLAQAPSLPTKKTQKSRSIDGFIQAEQHRQAPQKVVDHIIQPTHAASKTVQPSVTASPLKKVHADISRVPAKQLPRHTPEKAKTLMRHVVKKPDPSLKRTTTVHTRTDILAKVPDTFVAPKLSHRVVDTNRQARAERIAKHNLIKRFARTPDHVIAAADDPVITHAVPARSSQRAASVTSPATGALPRPSAVGHHGALDGMVARTPTHGHVAAPKPTTDIFEQALARAKSHEQTLKTPLKLKKKRRLPLSTKFASAGAFAVTLIVLGGFFAYQNSAVLNLKLANARAGFSAQLPESKPAGFSIGKFSYSPGTVAVNYSADDNRHFTLSQKVSNWDDESLLDNFVVSSAKSYNSVSVDGRTVYIYDKNNATWIDNGVWYQVTSNGSLGSTDLLNIASTM